MTSNMTNASNILRLYAWEALKENIPTFTEITAEGKTYVPIVPVEDEPVLSMSGKPYIVYGFAENSEGNVHIRRGTCSFRIQAGDTDELSYIITVLSRLFERQDESAANVNLWSSMNNYSGELIGIRFTWLDTTYIENADAARSEAGPVRGVINIGYRYVSSQTVKTFSPVGNWV
jgi:hypothetical protein